MAGVIEVDTFAQSDAEAMYLAQTVVNHLPRITGSERDVEFHLAKPTGYCSSSNVDEFGQQSNLYNDDSRHLFVTQERILITIYGNLRDRMFKRTLRETTKMLARLSSRLWIRNCFVRVKSDMGDTFIFDNPSWIHDRDLTDWTQKLQKKDSDLNDG